MRRILIGAVALAVAMPVAAPASAQMNPASIGAGLVMPSAINAQAKRQREGGSTRSARAEQASGCAQLPSFRRDFGPNDPDVRQLEKLCRSRGYSTGG